MRKVLAYFFFLLFGVLAFSFSVAFAQERDFKTNYPVFPEDEGTVYYLDSCSNDSNQCPLVDPAQELYPPSEQKPQISPSPQALNFGKLIKTSCEAMCTFSNSAEKNDCITACITKRSNENIPYHTPEFQACSTAEISLPQDLTTSPVSGYHWYPFCGAQCFENSDCQANTIQSCHEGEPCTPRQGYTPLGDPEDSRWCYRFSQNADGPGSCIQLRYTSQNETDLQSDESLSRSLSSEKSLTPIPNPTLFADRQEFCNQTNETGEFTNLGKAIPETDNCTAQCTDGSYECLGHQYCVFVRTNNQYASDCQCEYDPSGRQRCLRTNRFPTPTPRNMRLLNRDRAEVSALDGEYATPIPTILPVPCRWYSGEGEEKLRDCRQQPHCLYCETTNQCYERNSNTTCPEPTHTPTPLPIPPGPLPSSEGWVFSPLWNKVPNFNQQNYTTCALNIAGCGPTTLANVLTAFDMVCNEGNCTPLVVDSMFRPNGSTQDPRYRNCGDHPTKDMQSTTQLFATRFGLSTRSTERSVTLREIKRQLETGNLVIGSVGSGNGNGHIFVVSGVNENQNKVFIHDSLGGRAYWTSGTTPWGNMPWLYIIAIGRNIQN